MRIRCDICGKEFKTTQGLRGHKTFVHGIHANHTKMSAMPDGIRPSETEEELENLINRVTKVEYAIEELKDALGKCENYMDLLATQNETQQLASRVKLIKDQVDKHDRWLNPRGLHEAVIGLNGGPIVDLERSLGNKGHNKR